ncbi:MAG: cytochrome c maturation protein CcmE [Actinomycetota bacterium]|nr:cytochrome c maturation protein CcmE [Actinomycetota bacterium]
MKRGRVFFAVAIIVGALGWVAAKGLTSALVYYNTPTDLLAKSASAVGERARLGGLVVPGSVQEHGDVIRFVVTDGTNHMTVIDTGGVPALFRAGQGVVVEGLLGRDGAFHADTVLVKHSGVYRPPSPGETPHSADLAGT